jgi:hypothetical protein
MQVGRFGSTQHSTHATECDYCGSCVGSAHDKSWPTKSNARPRKTHLCEEVNGDSHQEKTSVMISIPVGMKSAHLDSRPHHHTWQQPIPTTSRTNEGGLHDKGGECRSHLELGEHPQQGKKGGDRERREQRSRPASHSPSHLEFDYYHVGGRRPTVG